MQVLSQSTLCFQTQVKGLSPLHRPLPKYGFSVHRTKSSLGIPSIQMPKKAQADDVSALPSFGASKLFSPSFFMDKGLRKSNRRNVYNAYSPSTSSVGSSMSDSERETEKLAQVSKRLEMTARYFKRLGGMGFWSQLVCTVVSAVILAFSVVITGSPTSPPTFYMTAAGIIAAFLSVFWSFGYIRLAERLQKNANNPAKAPPRADVVKNLKNGIIINIIGMAATVIGMQATVGVLVAKALTSSANPYYQGISPGYSPVLALDVFLVQACGNTLLSHFLGLLFSLELLRSVTLPPPPETVMPRVA
uniref:Protein TIC 21, chloroplastic n=1 Tax=Araucaria cunninghamii TaxID=56994 RepID=A0A0D6QWX8_ARACU